MNLNQLYQKKEKAYSCFSNREIKWFHLMDEATKDREIYSYQNLLEFCKAANGQQFKKFIDKMEWRNELIPRGYDGYTRMKDYQAFQQEERKYLDGIKWLNEQHAEASKVHYPLVPQTECFVCKEVKPYPQVNEKFVCVTCL